MMGADGKRLGLKELWLPLLFAFLGAALVVGSVPGRGKTGLTALGMSLALIGVAIARNRIRSKSDGES